MAAYPLPENTSIPVYIADAMTAVDIVVVPGQTIDWENHTSFQIQITVLAVNGKLPLNVNTFTVPPAHAAPGAFENSVLSNATPGTYPFTRGATEGNGKIIVQTNLK